LIERDEYVNPVYWTTEKFPRKSKKANWYCPICNSYGKPKAKYLTTLEERIHAHFVCRCRRTKKYEQYEIWLYEEAQKTEQAFVEAWQK